MAAHTTLEKARAQLPTRLNSVRARLGPREFHPPNQGSTRNEIPLTAQMQHRLNIFLYRPARVVWGSLSHRAGHYFSACPPGKRPPCDQRCGAAPEPGLKGILSWPGPAGVIV